MNISAFRSAGILCGLSLALLVPSMAHAAIIDNFTNAFSPNVTMKVDGLSATTSQSQTMLSGVLGGNRMATITQVSPLGNAFDESELLVRTDLPLGPRLVFNSDSGVISGYVLVYNNIGPLNIAGTSISWNATNSGPGGMFKLQVMDNAMNTSNTVNVALGTAFSGTKSALASLFTGVDLTMITKLTFSYDGDADSDMELRGNIITGAVPEPSSLVIMLTGLGLAGMFYRRRQKNQLVA